MEIKVGGRVLLSPSKSLNASNVCTLSCQQAAESEVSFEKNMDGSSMRIGIIRTRWNEKHVKNLSAACVQALKECKVDEANIFETTVPGSFELPLAARFLALSGTVDAIVCIGVLIKGETMHFEFISDAVVCVLDVCRVECDFL
jgi:6,7-dimethyl-8-ribityllumazine synthase